MFIIVETFRLKCRSCQEIFYSQDYQEWCPACAPHWSLPIAAAAYACFSTIFLVAALIHALRAWR
jgi:hypothetical protein